MKSWNSTINILIVIIVTIIVALGMLTVKRFHVKKFHNDQENKTLKWGQSVKVNAICEMEAEAIKAGVAEWVVINEFGHTEFRWKKMPKMPKMPTE